MRLFIYKTIIIFITSLIFFKLTFTNLINNYEEKILTSFSKERLGVIKNKLKEELKTSIKKDKILNEEDARLIGLFIEKIKKEISIYNKN